jgi:hypothetical protein
MELFMAFNMSPRRLLNSVGHYGVWKAFPVEKV